MPGRCISICAFVVACCVSINLNAAENSKTSGADVKESQDSDGENRALSAGSSLIGKMGPALTLKTIDGEPIDLLQLYGNKPVYLKFWATWCVPCRQQMPGFEEIYKQYGDKIKVIAVNTGFNDDEKSVRRYRQQLNLTMPIVIDDGALAGLLNLSVTPTHVLIDRSGRIAHVGHKDDQKLHEALNKVVASSANRHSSVAANTPVTPQFNIGSRVSGISFTTLKGKKVDLNGPSAKPRVLVFLAPWCESYLAESRPAMANACAQHRKQIEALLPDSKMDWYGISSNLWVNRQEVIDYQKTNLIALDMAYDQNGDLFRTFAIRQIPSLVVIDSTGNVSKILGPETENIKAAIR